MTYKSKITAGVLATASLAAPAFAHIGDHSVTSQAHFLIEHGLAIGAVVAVIGATVAYIILKKA